MCYSAQVQEAYDEYVTMFGADIDIETFWRLYGQRMWDPKIKIPRAMDVSFQSPKSELDKKIRESIIAYQGKQAKELEAELAKQRKRLEDPEPEQEQLFDTKKLMSREHRIATEKIEAIQKKLADLGRIELSDDDSRIYPGYYCPVMVYEHGNKVVRPMRYHCRIPNAPESYDKQFPGTYNARRDNLEGYWKEVFGYTHGIIIVNAFYEHVQRSAVERVVLEFTPRPVQPLFVACLWSKWRGPVGGELYSFAIVTDEPPPEIAAAGHDRCLIPIKRENVDAWLNPNPRNLAASYAILDDRERPYYEHREIESSLRIIPKSPRTKAKSKPDAEDVQHPPQDSLF